MLKNITKNGIEISVDDSKKDYKKDNIYTSNKVQVIFPIDLEEYAVEKALFHEPVEKDYR